MADVIMMNAIEATASRLGIDISQVDLDSIKLLPGEDFGIISDDGDVYEDEETEVDSGFGNIIVIDNLPVVPREKFEKLEGVIRKIYCQIGVIKEDGLWMPFDPETKKTLGYCFIEYNTPQEVELATEKTYGYKLDKAHIFVVNMFGDFDKFMKVPDEWAPPEIKCIHQENLQKWLTDEKAQDQFVIRAGSDTEVLWNDARHLKPEPVYKRSVSRLKILICRHHHTRLCFYFRNYTRLCYLSIFFMCVCVCCSYVFKTRLVGHLFSEKKKELLRVQQCVIVSFLFLRYWTESFVQWSPLGTYLATVHRQGAAVWGGASTFNRLMHYTHPQVKLIDFSSGEKYLVTYSSHEPSNPRDANVWRINHLASNNDPFEIGWTQPMDRYVIDLMM